MIDDIETGQAASESNHQRETCAAIFCNYDECVRVFCDYETNVNSIVLSLCVGLIGLLLIFEVDAIKDCTFALILLGEIVALTFVCSCCFRDALSESCNDCNHVITP